MLKARLGWILVLAVVGWSTDALALTVDPSPVDAGNVIVNTTDPTTPAQIESTFSETLDHFDVTGADCGLFVIEAVLPAVITTTTPLSINVRFTPDQRGPASCTVTMRSPSNASLGTFVMQGNGVAQDITVPMMTNFGPVRVANSATPSTSQDISIDNEGELDLEITALAISGAAAGDYTINPAVMLPATVASGGKLPVTIVFNPSASGTRNASFDITSDDPVTPMVSVALTGQGTNARIAVTNVPFGDVTNGSNAFGTITVSNTAAAPVGPLRVSSATISGGSWFTFDANGSGCLGLTTCGFGGGFDVTSPPASVVVRCSPPLNATGMQTATVTFTSDSDSGGDNIADLSCEAGRPDIMVSTTALAFGDVLVNTTSAPQTVVVSNVGNRDLVFTATETSPRFALSGCITGCVVAPMSMQMFNVTFSPNAPVVVGPITINVDTNDPDPVDDPVEISATGRGIAPAIMAPGSIALGTVEVGKTGATVNLTVTNNGMADLTISNAGITVGAADYTVVTGTVGTQTTVVAPGNMVTWGLACNPVSFGPRPTAAGGQFQITSNAFNAPTANITLTCTGQQGVLATVPTSHDFGPVQSGLSVPRVIQLRNNGNVTVNNITAVVNPTTTGYSIDPGTPTMLAAGGTANVTVRFAPQSGADGGPATVTFTGNWGVTPTATMAVLNLNGDGLTAGFDVSPATVNYGDLRFDTQVNRTFCIVNTQQAALNITDIAIAPAMGTFTGEFAVTQIRRQTVCGVGGTIVTIPPMQPLSTGQILEVTVRADPANRTGAMNATVTVTSDLAMNPTRTVTLAGNSTTAIMAVMPGMTVDFGAVDVQGAPAMQTVTITNMGNANLDLGGFMRTANANFTFALPSNTTLAPTQSLPIAITFRPTMARPAGQEETVLISHTIGGAIANPGMMGQIILRGRGIDRSLVLGPTPTFPDTFRNPGSAGPIGTVMVTNPGEAPLNVSAVMITNDSDVWQLLDPDPAVITGGASHDFRVRFTPTRAGRAPDARLQLINDDVMTGPPITPRTTEIMLTGNGLSRDVTFGPDVIDLGYVMVGDVVTRTGVVVITNKHPLTDLGAIFDITAITLEDDSVFSIENAPTGVEELTQTTTKAFDVTFAPTAPGVFTTRALLLLDEDETPTGMLELRGTAVFADARGGGGCSSSSRGAGGAGLGVAFVLAALLLRRRRALVLCAIVAAPGSVRAEDDIVISVFDPTPATRGAGFQLQSAEVGASGDWAASAVVSHATDPLFVATEAGNANVIERSTLVNIGIAVAFLERFEVGLRMPFYTQAGEPVRDSSMELPVEPANGTARGDLTVHGKLRLWRRSLAGNGAAAIGTSVQLTMPTATDGQLTGVDKPSGRVLMLGSLVPGAFGNRVTLTANLGGVLRVPSTYYNIEQKSGIAWGLGTSVRVADPLWLAAEVYGEMVPSSRRAEFAESATTLSPAEWLGGLHWRPDHRVTVSLAAGRGLTSAAGAPALRGVFALSYTPGAPELTPTRPPKPDLDGDGDGVRDSADRCQGELEDVDLFDDSDGCPDPDNDQDGVADAADKCPIDAEDRDGFQDTDGCADKDDDNDGIADATDKCPRETEDKDGFQDVDGCPDLDNDRDGVVDAADKCPDAKETINGNQDDDGCPDRGDSLVVLSPDRIELLDTIQFTGSHKIARGSLNLIAQVAATMRAHPELVRVRVTCHVHPSGDDDRDQEVSEKRATAVREWMVQWGIAPSRLEMRGFGSTKKLAPAGQRGAQQINDRIELIILERK